MTSKYVVGIDAGGTGVRVALADAATGAIIAEREVTADAAGGPEPMREALRLLGVSGDVAAVCAGITKVSRAGVLAAWEAALAAEFPLAVRRVTPDYVTAFHGALSGGVGVVVAAGTGSVVYGENAAGVGVRVGGRGWEFGDEGSGAWLTTEMIRRTLRACDGLQPTSPLTDAVCEALGTSEAGAFAEAARRRATEEGRGFLTPLALARAQAGDTEAANLFVGAAGWLALLARTVVRKLEIAEDAAVLVAGIGGMWETGELLTVPFANVLHRHLPNAVVVAGDGPPLRGAIRLACRAAGERIDTQ